LLAAVLLRPEARAIGALPALLLLESCFAAGRAALVRVDAAAARAADGFFFVFAARVARALRAGARWAAPTLALPRFFAAMSVNYSGSRTMTTVSTGSLLSSARVEIQRAAAGSHPQEIVIHLARADG
jgi:hypothetical protein